MKLSHVSISIVLILSLISGCSQTKTPIAIHPPTPTALAESSATPADTTNPGAPGIGDSLYPGLGNGGYDVQHYTLDLNVSDVTTSELDGLTTISARATQDLGSFNLDFIGFDITDIRVNERPAQFSRSEQELTITPSTLITANEAFTVQVDYQGSPESMRSEALSLQTGWVTFEGGSFVLSEPDGAASFYPVNDHPLDKASYTFRITVPDPYEAVANGVLTETVDNGATTTFVFEAEDPMASYLATINIDEFDIETSQSANGIPIRNYFPTGYPEASRRLFDPQPDMLDYFSETFGTYPFELYGALVIDTEFGAALETQTMSIFSKSMLDPNYVEASHQVIAHELAHQWFGDSVSVADWRDIWLNESFATYAEGLWTEHTRGREALDDWMRAVYAFILEHRESMSPPGEPSAETLFNPGVYYWGALGLHALRLEVGDEAFFEILRTYHDRYKGGNVRTSDFISVAEEVSGRNLQSFFDAWLYSEDLAPIPALELEAK